MKFTLLCLTLLGALFTQGQNDDLYFLKGKVVVQIKELNEIYVFNTRSESTIVTDEKGDFSIFVKVGDTLIFSGLQIVSKKVVLTKNDISKTLLAVPLHPKVFELQEVKINEFGEINAVSLGILQNPAKKYTPAERRLRTAGVFKWYSPLLIPLGGMDVDGLINSISGRTAMLKKEVEIEKKERLKRKIENYFEEDFYTATLKIPAEFVEGFLFYAVQDQKLRQFAADKNKALMRFQLGEVAANYLELITTQD